jgi:DDE superfamily endonuclease/Transposase
MQQTVLVVSLLTVGAAGAAYKRLLCLYGSQKICPSCEKWKLLKKFSGHSTCRDCRSSSSSSVPTTSIRLDRASFISFFDHEHSQGSRLSLIQRSSIVALSSLGFDVAKIAELSSCDPRTIQHWIDHFAQHGNLADEPRSGRPPVTAPEVRRDLQLNVSSRTVRRRLDQAGLFGRVARVSYPFTQEDVRQRLAFVSNYGGWNESQWNTVLFSDETHVILGGNGQVWVQRPEDTAFLSQFMTQRDPFPEKISLWGCFSAQGIGASRVFDGTMDSRLLTDTFTQYMKPHALETWPAQQWYFLQDNAPYHTSNESRAWLHNNGIDCIDFPPYSPDLNPIENLWADLKRRVELRCPCDSTELKQFLTEEWTATDPEYLRCLAHSMIDRCKAVAACRGFKTKY